MNVWIIGSLPHRQLRKGLLTIRVGTYKLILVTIDGLKTKAFIVILYMKRVFFYKHA